jgi:TrpR-related protein YerC/YecD
MAGKDRKRRRAMYDMILKLNSYQECCDFFDDLCTGKELEALEQRFEVARMLTRNKVYMDIMKETGASSATISRVKRMLSDGTGCLGRMIEAEMSQPEKED